MSSIPRFGATLQSYNPNLFPDVKNHTQSSLSLKLEPRDPLIPVTGYKAPEILDISVTRIPPRNGRKKDFFSFYAHLSAAGQKEDSINVGPPENVQAIQSIIQNATGEGLTDEIKRFFIDAYQAYLDRLKH